MPFEPNKKLRKARYPLSRCPRAALQHISMEVEGRWLGYVTLENPIIYIRDGACGNRYLLVPDISGSGWHVIDEA